MDTIRVIVNGAQGKMGQATVLAVSNDPELHIVGQAGKGDDLIRLVKDLGAQVVVDFTSAESAFDNASKIIDSGAHPVIGTTGLSSEQIELLKQHCAKKKLGGIIAPNFSIGAILMMQYAHDCARYFSHVEIIELHHDRKMDAPSGTALRTAETISEAKEHLNPLNPQEKQLLAGARGARHHNIPIHSIRLPGLLAHQAVIFGDSGETLTIRHDTLSREAFMPGVCLACKEVVKLEGLVYGLEQIL